jgi:uncharacterized protein (TIGR03435 family)
MIERNVRNLRRPFLLAAGLMAAAMPVAFGQGSAKTSPITFGAVSIRPANPDSTPDSVVTPDGFRATNLALFGLFQIAYVPTGAADTEFFRVSRVSGAPNWLTRERFDMIAKVADADLAEWQKPASRPAMLRGMVRVLLEERLKAVAHIDSKEMPVFNLVVAKNGPKFKAAETVNATELRTKHPGAIVAPGGAAVVPANGMRQINFFAASMRTLTPIVANLAGRPVEDKTGLTGRYDFSIHMSLNSLGPAIEDATAKAGMSVVAVPPPPPPPPPPGMVGGSGTPPGDSDPSISTALQEDLGLRLEPAKGMVEMLVIDHVERPTDN